MTRITILSSEVIEDLKSAGWLESELNIDSNLHRRHESADICENPNVDRVWRILGVCVAEIKFVLRSVLVINCPVSFQNDLLRPERWVFDFKSPLDCSSINFIKEKIHQYLVANVMADRLKVIIPEAVAPWLSQAKDAMAEIGKIASSSALNYPVRRPLYPF